MGETFNQDDPKGHKTTNFNMIFWTKNLGEG
jgi:hypothetical protein